MKRFIILLIFLATIFAAILGPAVLAQDELRLSSLWVRLWPEYDQPGLLVIYIGELAESTTYPATVSLRMPARVVAPHVVAVQGAPGEALDEADYQLVDGDLWRTVIFEVNGPRFQFEYYDSLERNDLIRQPLFTWPGDYPVDSLLVEVQQPPHASDLSIDPALPSAQVSQDDGLLYHVGEFGPLDAGAMMSFQMRYSRDEDALTADLLSALQADTGASTGANPFTETGTSGGSGTDLLLIVAVAVVSFLLGAATMRIAVNVQMSRRRR